MQILNPNTFYEKLITEIGIDSISLYSLNDTFVENKDGSYGPLLDLEIFNKSGEWLENQTRIMNTDSDDSFSTYGNLTYLGTVLDDTSYIVPQYTELFKLEMICFENQRDNVISIMDEYAANLNNHQYTDDDDNEIYITLGEHATPVYGEKQDIGGCERFITSLTILVRITSGVITSKKIEISIKNDEGFYENVKYVLLDMKRDADVIDDERSGFEKGYDVNKTDFTMVLGSLYLNDFLSRTVMKFLLMPENMNKIIYLKYKDKSIDIEKEFKLYITGVNPKIQFGTPISYTVSFKKISE